MSIAFDSSSQSSISTNTVLTYSHTCTGSNLKLILFIFQTGTISTVTYNGVSMTQSDSNGAGSIWYLDNPATGAHNIVVTLTGSANMYANSASYTGCDTGILDHTAGTSTATASISLSLTPAFNNCWLVMGAGGVANKAIVTNNGSTTVRTTQNDAVPGDNSISDTNGTVLATSTTLSVKTTDSSNNTWKAAMVVISPLDTSARYWVGGTGTWDNSTSTHWSTSSGGSTGASWPTSTTTATHFDASSGGGTVTLGAAISCQTLDFNGYTGILASGNTLSCTDISFTGHTGTWSGVSALTASGNFTLGSGMTLSYTGAITLSSTATGKTITTAGKTILSALTLNGVGGGWTLQDNITNSSSITVTNGTLSLSSMTVTLSGTGTVWNDNGGTITPGTSTIKLTDASSSTKTFAGGGKTYNNLWLTGAGTGAFIISGSNTFNDFKVDTPPHTINFTAGSTQTLTTFTVNGTAGNLMTLQSTINGSNWYMVRASNTTISCDYLSLRDSHVS